MITDKEFLEVLKLPPRDITADEVLKVQELLSYHFKEVKICDTEADICNYSYIAYCPDQVPKGDEDAPLYGCGWHLKEAILSLALNPEIYNEKHLWYAEDLKEIFNECQEVK